MVEPQDVFSYWGRSIAYWLVTAVALQAGGCYASRSFSLEQVFLLVIAALPLLPFYVIYGIVYDLDRAPQAVTSDAPASSTLTEYLRGSRNNAWILALVTTWFGTILLLWLVPGRIPTLTGTYAAVTLTQLGYYGLVLIFHGHYAFWILAHRDRRELQQVRYETFIPVLIVSFAFFFAATYGVQTFSLFLYAVPVAIWAFYLGLHFLGKYQNLAASRFARLSALFLLIVPLAVLALGRLPAVTFPRSAGWAKTSLVALIFGLYLSLFELWRLTAIAGDTRRSSDSRQQDNRTRYYQATLVSHAVSVVALPFMFVFGDFGTFFLWAAEIHALLAFAFWYKYGAASDWSTRWRMLKLLFAFFFFLIAILDVFVIPRSLADRYPSGLSGLSASLFVALLFAVLASPVVQYLTDPDTRRNRSFRELFIGFFSLPTNQMVFRQAAVLSGGLFIVMNFVYEVTVKVGTPTAAKASYAFWLYAAATMIFSILAFFVDPSGTGGGRRSQSTASTAAATLVGIFQTLRILTGGITFLGVFVVGLSAGASGSIAAGTAVAVGLVAMGSFGINDYYDHAKDAVNARHRAIPSGRLTPGGALACGLGSLISGAVIGMRILEGAGLGVFLLGCLGAAAYNELVRIAPTWKGTATAFLSGLVIVLDFSVFRLDTEVLWLSVSCLLFVLGRELLMDVRDIAGDQLFGSRTLAVRLGPTRSEVAGFSIAVLSTVPLLLFVSSTAKGPVAYMIAATYCGLILMAAGIWFIGEGSRTKWLAIEVLKLPLIAGIGLMVI